MPRPATTNARLRVGEYEVDLRSGELRHNGNKVKLQERPFQILAALLERPGEMMTREEIRQKLWPNDTFVDFEHSINTAVKKLREALGDDAENPRFVVTLPRRGYRLIAPVEFIAENGRGLEGGMTPSSSDNLGSPKEAPRPKHRRMVTVAGAVLILLLFVGYMFVYHPFWRRIGTPSLNSWVQVTRFTDGATSPALSPDGA